MMIKNNPFTSDVYVEEWMKSFFHGKQAHSFLFIKDISFTKNKFFPLYTNVGKYKTCAITYELDQSGRENDYKGKVFLVYDVPSFVEIDSKPKTKGLGVKKIGQYEGFLIDLRPFHNIEEYLSSQFNSKQKRNVLHRLKKFEKDHNFSYGFYEGKLEKEQFEDLFEELYGLMELQFRRKEDNNSHAPIEIKEWYRSLFFRLLEKNQASFKTIKNDEKTISSDFSYNSDNVVFSSIPVLDMNYTNYGLGNIRSLKAIDWSIKNGFDYYDLGKGSYGYKHRWASQKYIFEYQIFYDKKSLMPILIANTLALYFGLKQFARKVYRKIRKKDN